MGVPPAAEEARHKPESAAPVETGDGVKPLTPTITLTSESSEKRPREKALREEASASAWKSLRKKVEKRQREREVREEALIAKVLANYTKRLERRTKLKYISLEDLRN